MHQPADQGSKTVVPRTDRKNRLLQAACERFLIHGYTDTSLDDIIADAGGSKSTLYRHFYSKEGLFEAVIAHLCAEFLAKLQSIDVTNTTLEAGLRAILQELVTIVTSPRHIAFYRLVINGSARFPQAGRSWYENGPMVSQGVILRLLDTLQMQGQIPQNINKDILAAILFDSLLSNLTTQVVILGRKSGEHIFLIIEELITLVSEHIALATGTR